MNGSSLGQCKGSLTSPIPFTTKAALVRCLQKAQTPYGRVHVLFYSNAANVARAETQIIFQQGQSFRVLCSCKDATAAAASIIAFDTYLNNNTMNDTHSIRISLRHVKHYLCFYLLYLLFTPLCRLEAAVQLSVDCGGKLERTHRGTGGTYKLHTETDGNRLALTSKRCITLPLFCLLKISKVSFK